MPNLMVLVLILLAASSSFASPISCQDVFINIEALTPQVSAKGMAVIDALNKPEILEPFLDYKNTKVSWNSFESLDKVKLAVKEYAVELQTMSPAQRDEDRKQMLRLINKNPSIAALFDTIARPPETDYLPTEYDLKRQIVSKLISSIKELPREYRPSVGKLSFDLRAKTLNQNAVNFVAEETRRFDEVFNKTSGFESYTDYEKALRSSDDSLIKIAIELIDHNQIETVMRRPESGRFWIPKTGFQNQHITGGSLGYKGKEGRNNVEANLTSMTKEEYSFLDDELKPKYGTLQISEDAGVNNYIAGSKQYGSDIYVFKKSTFDNRSTFYPGDGLDFLARMCDECFTEVRKPLSWNGMFFPWSHRLLMVPFMLRGLSENYFGSPAPKIPANIALRGWHVSYNKYWEFQVYGRLDLDMVEAFEFEGNPPSGEFLTELKRRHIKIIDARTRPSKEWIDDNASKERPEEKSWSSHFRRLLKQIWMGTTG